MRTTSIAILLITIITLISGCGEKFHSEKYLSFYQIDSIAYSLYDNSADTVIYRYTFIPGDDAVFETLTQSNDTSTYLSKDSYVSTYNSQSTVMVKGNRIFYTGYLQPYGMYGQDGYRAHRYYYYNSGSRIDSIVHVTYGEFDLVPIDTVRETQVITYSNGDPSVDTSNTAYSGYANQKDLIGLDINEFIGAFYSTIHSNPSAEYSDGIKDDIRAFAQNCFIHNFNTLNSNAQHLYSKLGGYDIVYTFDASHSNRVKEIDLFLSGKKYEHYTFFYKN